MPPLTELRVIDHGHVWAGPLLGMFLADLGAEVIKVGAPHRRSGVSIGGAQAPVGSIGGDRGSTSADDPRAFHGLDRGKKSISIHLGDPRGKALYLRLVEQSDVVLENFSPRVMPSLGLSYDVLSEVNPRIIMVALSASGATEGPWRNLVTYGPSLAALYGLKSLLGYPDDPQPREDTADLDPTAAGHAFVALLAALEYRDRTGRGQFIDLAQGEATLQRAAAPLMDWLLNGRDSKPRGNRGSSMAPHGVYPAANDDAWLAVVVRTDAEWSALCALSLHLDRTEWRTMRGRLADQDALDEAVSAWTRNHDAMELSIELQGRGVPAFPLMDPTLLLIDEDYAALSYAGLDLRADVAAPLRDGALYTGAPWKLSRTPAAIAGPVPNRGEHDDEIYGDLLGLDEAARVELREAGVI
ncbi:MAG: CoA transferase [Chloroflexi bacterium]|nr:CoA transferase [Chloroflexota bacterium]MYF80758.1 CoA transferase [Chloroflexota bacterium]MYI05428.1 CoA transferase [Chloroflexota bacterium]